jgi:hypothetical protein
VRRLVLLQAMMRTGRHRREHLFSLTPPLAWRKYVSRSHMGSAADTRQSRHRLLDPSLSRAPSRCRASRSSVPRTGNGKAATTRDHAWLEDVIGSRHRTSWNRCYHPGCQTHVGAGFGRTGTVKKGANDAVSDPGLRMPLQLRLYLEEACSPCRRHSARRGGCSADNRAGS